MSLHKISVEYYLNDDQVARLKKLSELTGEKAEKIFNHMMSTGSWHDINVRLISLERTNEKGEQK